MIQEKLLKNVIDGVMLIDKPAGITSNQTLKTVKHMLRAKKVGHTGSLDPLATGVLPLCFGEATKFSHYLLNADKRYLTTVRLGIKTDTGDIDGEITKTSNSEQISATMVNRALANFRGEIMQTPPVYSALKKNGTRLYKLSRQGEKVEPTPRQVKIYSIELKAFRSGKLAECDLEIYCSKGTYIRSIASDLGDMLGCGGCVAKLRRSQAGNFYEKDSLSLETVKQQSYISSSSLMDLLLPIESPIMHMPAVYVSATQSKVLQLGSYIRLLDKYSAGDVRIYIENNNQFIGVGNFLNGILTPKRLVRQYH